mmetsp:Transcript_24591/g.63378  ORF Transcript_24591/g.63378 Transcript_24591/m.63378 type:complete len:106 (-) Transcript_24591:356-673(-)
MLSQMSSCQSSAVLRKSGAPGIRTSMQPVQRRRPINTRAIDVNLIATLAERTGEVEAPIGLAVGIGVVVSLAGTALIPLILKPGDDASKQIFDAKEKDPLDKSKK